MLAKIYFTIKYIAVKNFMSVSGTSMVDAIENKMCMTFRKDTELIHFDNISNYKYSLEYYLITDKE